jgi:hypothetical protein
MASLPQNGKVVNRSKSFLPVSKRVNFVGVIPDNDTTISLPHTFNCLIPRQRKKEGYTEELTYGIPHL